MPIMAATLPLWSEALDLHGWLHVAFALVLIPITLFAMRSASKRHGQRSVLALLGVGLGLVVFAVVAHDLVGEVGGTLVTLIGSLLLILGHWQNWQARTACRAVVH